ncbi:hypothetical protein K439DRAFT_1414140 [Ramaria rubella]|nr:hypothetical protein K439DRAFT_1414140 [Ramaria rubella]
MTRFERLVRWALCLGSEPDNHSRLLKSRGSSVVKEKSSGVKTTSDLYNAPPSCTAVSLLAQDDERGQIYTTTPPLPIELLDAVLLYSTSHDLCQVAKSNRTCLAVATRILYREVELMNPVKTIRCITTLSKRSDIALNVRKFHVTDDLTNGLEVLPAYYKLLHKALCQMHNLISLCLLIGGPRSFVLTGCLFRLKSFTTACHWDKPLVRWLESQDEITSALFCGKFHHDARISDRALPKLQRISASPLILAAVVPSRPVEEAELCLIHPWLLNSDIISTTLRILTYSSAVVHTLQFITHLTGFPETTLSALRAVPEHLPKLASLAIHIVRGSVTQDILDGLVSIFSLFKSLRSVMFLSKNESDALHDEELTDPLAVIWHNSCPSLEIVSFPNSIWVRNPKVGWVTLKELERMLSERERDLEQKEKDRTERVEHWLTKIS